MEKFRFFCDGPGNIVLQLCEPCTWVCQSVCLLVNLLELASLVKLRLKLDIHVILWKFNLGLEK